MKKKILLFCFLFSSISCFAQQNISLFGLSQLIDQSKVKPAYIGDYQFGLSLFPLSYQIYSNGPTYRDFIGTGEAGNGNNVLQFPSNKLARNQENLLRAGSEIETFRLLYNQNKWSFNLSHSSKAQGILDYSGTLAEIAIRGNAPFIGQTIPIDTDFQAFSYEEIGLGTAVNLGKLKIGGRVKFLFGHAIANTKRSSVSIYTDEEIYQVDLDMDVQIETAGVTDNEATNFNFGPIGLNFSNKDNVLIQTPELLFNVNDDLFKFSGNTGLAVDLGVDWQLNEQVTVSLSALDIGKINWKDNPKTYTANDNFEFDGLNLGQLTFDGQESISLNNVQDSFDIIDFNTTTTSFSTNLPAQFYLGLGYQYNNQWHFHGTLYHTSFKNNGFTAAAVGANYQLNKQINLGMIYTVMNDEAFLLGFNASFQFGPLQFYALTDNILAVFRPTDNNTINARVGVGLEFGKRKEDLHLPQNH